jgi:antitoxin component YwqK of YwqJK toxin-antitoxin module
MANINKLKLVLRFSGGPENISNRISMKYYFMRGYMLEGPYKSFYESGKITKRLYKAGRLE